MKLEKIIIRKIFSYANNNCHTCKNFCQIPFIKQNKFYYCSKICYFHI